jgi:hypothetical protein
MLSTLRKCTVWLSMFSPTMISSSALLSKTWNFLRRFFAKDTQYDPKTRVTKKTLSFTVHFGNGAQINMLSARGKKTKISNIWVNLKNIFKNVGYTYFFISINGRMMQKKVTNRLWKSRACIPLSCSAGVIFSIYLMQSIYSILFV